MLYVGEQKITNAEEFWEAIGATENFEEWKEKLLKIHYEDFSNEDLKLIEDIVEMGFEKGYINEDVIYYPDYKYLFMNIVVFPTPDKVDGVIDLSINKYDEMATNMQSKDELHKELVKEGIQYQWYSEYAAPYTSLIAGASTTDMSNNEAIFRRFEKTLESRQKGKYQEKENYKYVLYTKGNDLLISSVDDFKDKDIYNTGIVAEEKNGEIYIYFTLPYAPVMADLFNTLKGRQMKKEGFVDIKTVMQEIKNVINAFNKKIAEEETKKTTEEMTEETTEEMTEEIGDEISEGIIKDALSQYQADRTQANKMDNNIRENGRTK